MCLASSRTFQKGVEPSEPQCLKGREEFQPVQASVCTGNSDIGSLHGVEMLRCRMSWSSGAGWLGAREGCCPSGDMQTSGSMLQGSRSQEVARNTGSGICQLVGLRSYFPGCHLLCLDLLRSDFGEEMEGGTC